MASKRKSVNFLPQVFRTHSNERFLSATMDPLIQEPSLKKMFGYIGQQDQSPVFEKNDFYVKFSFWDAANGNKIPLIPSCDGEKDKKWFQKRNTFKQEYNYLKYVLDYNSKTYKIYEYNTTTNDFDLERTNFDLYELSFDQYFESVFVSNEIPFDATTLKPKTRPFCPLKFGIRSLYTDKYLGQSVTEFNRINYTKSDTFLYNYFGSDDKKYHTGRFLDKIENYIKNKNGTPISKLQSSEFVYPKISEYRDEIVVNGYTNLVQNFFAHNVDTEQWKIRKLSLQDIAVTIDDKITYDKSYYQEMESSWEMPNRDRISESMTLMISNIESIQTNTGINDFIIKIMTEYKLIICVYGCVVVEKYKEQIHHMYIDVSKVEDCKHLFDITYLKFGHVDGFFSYAGITPAQPLLECTEDIHDEIFNINVKGALFCSKYAVKYMNGRVKNPIFVLCGDDTEYWLDFVNDEDKMSKQFQFILLDDKSEITMFILLQQFKNYIMSNSSYCFEMAIKSIPASPGFAYVGITAFWCNFVMFTRNMINI